VILEEISVKNWRGYREPHTFRFQQGINLLVGRNEGGKSTLFEALTRALFDRHNSKTEEIRAIQPIASSLGPEVKVQFRANSTRYKVEKRFLQDPESRLFSEREGRWELDHEGDQSDTCLLEVLRGEATARTAARSEHRGLAQALWYLQTDGAIPEKTWNDGVKQGLQGLVQVAARPPHEKAILERLEEAYDEHWTPTGRIASDSDLGRLQAEMPALDENLSNLRGKAQVVEGYRGDQEEFQSLETQKRIEHEKARNDLAESSELVLAAEALEREKENKERAQTEATEKTLHLHQELSQIQEKQQKIGEWRKQIQDLQESLSETTAEAKQEAAASERHAARWKEELEPELKEVEANLRALHAATNVRKLEKDRERLEKHLDKVSRIQKQLQDRKKERTKFMAPDAKEQKRFNKASEELGILEAKVEAGAVRVAFEWDTKTRKVTTRPQIDENEAGEYIVAEPTEFQIRSVGRVRVRSGAQALKDLLSQKTQLQQEVDETLRHFGVTEAESLADLHEKGRELDRSIAELEVDLEEVKTGEPDAEGDLARVRRDIEEDRRVAGRLLADETDRSGRWIREQITSKEKEKERLIREIVKEQDLEKKAGQSHLKFIKAHETTSNTLAERNAQVKTQEESIADTLKVYSTVDHLKGLIATAQEESEKAKASLEGILKDYEERVETPRRLHLQAQERVNELDKQMQDLRGKIIETLARIEESAAQGNYGQLADLEIEMEFKSRRIEVLQRRADGVKLLHDLVASYEKQRFAALSGPIQDLVNRWLQLLTEGTYDALRIDDALKPVGVQVARYGADLPWMSLSYGAREQVVVLLRLAIGVLVSREGKNLVVIDDRLVNADPVRIKRLCLILQEAAKTCQLVVATCNDTPYAGLGAHIIRVPSDGVGGETLA
jgi:DNA repair exonuclease SbcCD ATPase subunit